MQAERVLMEDAKRIELSDAALRRLVAATISDAFRVVASTRYDDLTYYKAAHAANWLQTTGREWAEITGYSVDRPVFRATVNAHLARHELHAALRDLSQPDKKSEYQQPLLPIGD